MKIKSLLLGSAAALVASPAPAPQTPSSPLNPKPSNMSAFATPSAPATSTSPAPKPACASTATPASTSPAATCWLSPQPDGHETYNVRSRFSFRVSTASETELGTLKTYMETRWHYDTNGGANSRYVAPVFVNGPDGYANGSEFSLNFD